MISEIKKRNFLLDWTVDEMNGWIVKSKEREHDGRNILYIKIEGSTLALPSTQNKAELNQGGLQQ
jgi:hypothetical protein